MHLQKLLSLMLTLDVESVLENWLAGKNLTIFGVRNSGSEKQIRRVMAYTHGEQGTFKLTQGKGKKQ